MKSLSHARFFAIPWIVACTKLLRLWDFQDKSTGVGCHFLLQGIFPTQGSNPGLSQCRQTLYCLSHVAKAFHQYHPSSVIPISRVTQIHTYKMFRMVPGRCVRVSHQFSHYEKSELEKGGVRLYENNKLYSRSKLQKVHIYIHIMDKKRQNKYTKM